MCSKQQPFFHGRIEHFGMPVDAGKSPADRYGERAAGHRGARRPPQFRPRARPRSWPLCLFGLSKLLPMLPVVIAAAPAILRLCRKPELAADFIKGDGGHESP
jgi:hypothetical protein